MTTKTESNNAFLIHISAFASYVFPLGGVLIPLIFWQLKKDESANLDAHGKQAVNFNLSFLLYNFVVGLSIGSIALFHLPSFTGVFGGISFVIILGIIRFVLILQAAIKANRNEFFKYPLTIEFIK
ncbi:hypothetical protein SAMN05444411_103163 [Lutibacter oricola]|uniref:DUF4870 domain-containing protein n=1 Tax=Lutibacter oricola TaxID=762486 RepID=A0A1H2Z8S9_9FLAO|nr:DUF4870 domain-containing protein [Lutibacter oricola]SDX13179.1 hypothetical protein SAMN05444411_103163 [Lutibacter oricola]